MAQAIPERMTAANCGQSSLIHVGTTDPVTDRRIVATLGGPWMGGMGARAGKDGIDVTDHDASNVFHLPIEVSEAELPVRFRRVELWQDSGGAGKWRGGLGYHVEVEWLAGKATSSVRRDRHKFAPWGLSGGGDAPLCRTMFAPAGSEPEAIPSKVQLELNPGDRLLLWTTGSGGHGRPEERDPERVLQDVLDEKVSPEAARTSYRVCIEHGAVNAEETKRLRDGALSAASAGSA
jgi:N-methylhydantoinase B